MIRRVLLFKTDNYNRNLFTRISMDGSGEALVTERWIARARAPANVASEMFLEFFWPGKKLNKIEKKT